MRWLGRTILSLSGWRLNPTLPEGYERSIMLAVPHTSNWDIWYARWAFVALGVPVRFTIKREWLRFPFGLLLRPLGAIGVDRRPKHPGEERTSMVEAMAALFEGRQRLAIMITPEGTRSLRTEWKTGFYYAALQANVPISFGYLDYAKKEAGVGGILHPTGNIAADMKAIMDFYKDKKGKYPENFSLDVRYA